MRAEENPPTSSAATWHIEAVKNGECQCNYVVMTILLRELEKSESISKIMREYLMECIRNFLENSQAQDPKEIGKQFLKAFNFYREAGQKRSTHSRDFSIGCFIEDRLNNGKSWDDIVDEYNRVLLCAPLYPALGLKSLESIYTNFKKKYRT